MSVSEARNLQAVIYDVHMTVHAAAAQFTNNSSTVTVFISV